MITAVTLNPCIDLTVTVPGFVLRQLNMIDTCRTDISGKAVNAARVLGELGTPAMCTGISFSANHAELAARLDSLGIAHDFVIAPGSIRTNIKVHDSAANTMTEINSRGDKVSPELLETACAKIVELAAKSEMAVMSGRIPNGAKDSIYRTLMQKIHGLNPSCKIVVDAERGALAEALRARPFLIKPNLYELGVSFGRNADTIPEILSVCGWVISSGAQICCVSMGGRGALIASREGAFHANALDITPRGFQGAGDSMVAGICKAVTEGLPLPDMLRYGIAAASASIIREGTQLCRRGDFEEMLPKVKAEQVG